MCRNYFSDLSRLRSKAYERIAITLLTACVFSLVVLTTDVSQAAAKPSADELMAVDCLLPGQVRRLGSKMTYLTPRRPIKTTAVNCKIRGGEYVEFDRANFATALKVWLAEAQAGDAEAQTYVGEIFEKGLGTDSDFPAAVTWYTRAAEQGYSRAMLNLGYLYEKGLGVEQDTREALNLYRRASGLEDDSLEFASSIQVSLAAKDKQIAELSEESEARQQEIARLRSQLKQKEIELNRIKQEQDIAQAKLADVQKQLIDPSLVTVKLIEEERTRLSNNNAQLKKKLAALTQSQTDLDQLASTLSASQKEAAKKNVELSQQVTKKDAEVERLRRRLIEVDSDLEESRQLLENDATKDITLVSRLNAVEEERNELEKQLKVSEQKALHLSSTLKDAQGQLDGNTEKYTHGQNEFEQRKALYELEKRRLEREKNQLAEKAELLAQKSDQDVAEIEKLRQQLEQQKSSYDSELGNLSKQYEATKLELAKSDVELSALASKDEEIAKLSRESEASQKEIARLRMQLEQKGSELSRIKQEQDIAQAKLADVQNQLQDPSLVTVKSIEEERTRLSNNNAQLKEKLVALTRSQTDLDQLASTLNARQKRAAEKNAELSQEVTKKDAEVERLRRRLIEVDSDLEESRQLLENDATKDIALVTRLNAVEEVRNELEQQLKISEQKALRLSSKLRDAQGQLDDNTEKYTHGQNEFEQQKALYELEKRQLEREKNQLAEKAELLAQKSDKDVAEIEKLRQQLEQQKSSYDSELGNLSKQYEATKLELAKSDVELSALKQQHSTQHLAVAESPTIELIEPPVTLTRSNDYVVGLQSGITERTVIGRITAPAGLLSFSVNDLAIDVDDSGLFHTTISVPEQRRKVVMSAIDAQGQRVTFEFDLVKPEQETEPVNNEEDTEKKERFRIKGLGKYYALVIGNNDYSNFRDLKTPAVDATEIARILEKRYGYKTKLLINANRYDILSALSELRKTLTEDDNLLVYYAGHGTINETTGQGYWLPVDAEGESIANWIATNSITDILNTMTTKHVLVVADSCYSGVLTRTALTRLQSGKTFAEWERWYNKMASLRARIVMTSGGLEPVNDGGGGKHSVFAQGFIRALKENDRCLDGYALFTQVRDFVKAAIKDLDVKQTPEYSPIKFSNHEFGEYLFQPVRV